uniref:Uncharacterized protein n=1 Tax=Otarine gammaherpesvirus 4 TaxID=2801541 RepID=A0A889IWB3_9GAMA|nr:hypothetical protein [Otarine gammaherpesvirus 4]
MLTLFIQSMGTQVRVKVMGVSDANLPAWYKIIREFSERPRLACALRDAANIFSGEHHPSILATLVALSYSLQSPAMSVRHSNLIHVAVAARFAAQMVGEHLLGFAADTEPSEMLESCTKQLVEIIEKECGCAECAITVARVQCLDSRKRPPIINPHTNRCQHMATLTRFHNTAAVGHTVDSIGDIVASLLYPAAKDPPFSPEAVVKLRALLACMHCSLLFLAAEYFTTREICEVHEAICSEVTAHGIDPNSIEDILIFLEKKCGSGGHSYNMPDYITPHDMLTNLYERMRNDRPTTTVTSIIEEMVSKHLTPHRLPHTLGVIESGINVDFCTGCDHHMITHNDYHKLGNAAPVNATSENPSLHATGGASITEPLSDNLATVSNQNYKHIGGNTATPDDKLSSLFGCMKVFDNHSNVDNECKLDKWAEAQCTKPTTQVINLQQSTQNTEVCLKPNTKRWQDWGLGIGEHESTHQGTIKPHIADISSRKCVTTQDDGDSTYLGVEWECTEWCIDQDPNNTERDVESNCDCANDSMASSGSFDDTVWPDGVCGDLDPWKCATELNITDSEMDIDESMEFECETDYDAFECGGGYMECEPITITGTHNYDEYMDTTPNCYTYPDEEDDTGSISVSEIGGDNECCINKQLDKNSGVCEKLNSNEPQTLSSVYFCKRV